MFSDEEALDSVERLSRNLCYKLHIKRLSLLRAQTDWLSGTYYELRIDRRYPVYDFLGTFIRPHSTYLVYGGAPIERRLIRIRRS